jgi:ABC-2 type transport system permease protein
LADRVRAGVVLVASLKRSLAEQTSELTPLVLQLVSLAIGLVSQAFLGHLVDAGHNGALGDYDGHYAGFLLLGMAMLDLQNSVVGGLSRAIRDAQLRGSLETLLTTPTPIPLLLTSLALPDVVLALGRMLLYGVAGVALFGLQLSSINFLGVVTVVAASLLGFAGLTLAAASLTMMLRRADPLNLLLLATSLIAGGVSYPRGILPHWLAGLGQLLPIAPALDGLRAACIHDAGPLDRSVWSPLLRLGVFFAVAGTASAWLFARTLSRARRDGSLTTY